MAATVQFLVVWLASIASILVVYVSVRSVLLRDLRSYLGQIASTAAALVDGSRHGKYQGPTSLTEAEFVQATTPLRAILAANRDIRFAYTGVLRGDTSYFVLDGDSTATHANVMEASAPTDGEREVWRTGRLTVERQPSATAWGMGIRAYAPIRDSMSGELTGYVGITMSADRYARWIDRIDRISWLGMAIALGFALLSGAAALVERRDRNRALIAELKAQRRLERARDRADAASLAKSEFLANVSAEFQDPVRGMIEQTESLEATSLTERQRRLVGTVHQSARALLAVTTDILDFAKLEAGLLSFESVSFDVATMVRQVSDLVAIRAAERGVGIEVRYGSKAPRKIVGDPVRVRQVLLNLASNAVKYTRQGSVTLAVDGDGAQLRLAVEDTGPGIPPDRLEMIFDRSRGEKIAVRQVSGTGLGLGLSRKLARMMGGDLTVRSELGRGSTFVFTVPVGHSAGAETELPRSPARSFA